MVWAHYLVFAAKWGHFIGLSAALDARFNSGGYLDFQNEQWFYIGS